MHWLYPSQCPTGFKELAAHTSHVFWSFVGSLAHASTKGNKGNKCTEVRVRQLLDRKGEDTSQSKRIGLKNVILEAGQKPLSFPAK